MKSEPATFGPSSMFPATAEGFMRAINADYRVMVSETIDWNWERSVDLGEWQSSRTLWMRGYGQLGCNVQRAFVGAPMLCDTSPADWRIHFDGMNFLGNPSDDDSPLIDLPRIDRSSFQNGGCYGGAINLRIGDVLDGYASQTLFHNFEIHRARRQGVVLEHARKVMFSGMCSIERNGLENPGLYAGIELLQDKDTEDGELGNQILDSHFEHDDPAHLGLWQRGTGKIDVVRCSHTVAGLKIETPDYTVERPRKINVSRWELPMPPVLPLQRKRSWWPF